MDSARRIDNTTSTTEDSGAKQGGGGAAPTTRGAVLAELQRMLLSDLKLGLEPAALDENLPLLEGGLGLDSITLFELITLVERRYGLSFPPEKMSSETFTSLGAMAQIVVDLQAGGSL